VVSPSCAAYTPKNKNQPAAWAPEATRLRGVMSATIGVIGTGRMGRAICERLSRGGLAVLATDTRPEREAEAVDAGARWVPDLGELMRAADVLVSVLPGTDALEEVAAALIPALGPGATWIDTTTAAPDRASELMAQAQRRGADCLVCTLGGGTDDALAGTLQLFVGGAAGVVERHQALLESLGSIEHVGDPRAAYLSKLLVNTLWFAQAVALGEALVLAAGEGVVPEVLIGAIGRSAAGGELVRRHGEALVRGDYLASYGLDRCCDQLRTVVALAAERGVPRELSATVQDVYRDALQRYGPVDGELLAVAWIEERAGVRLADGR
jgi:3-hydroxyisobutyrate dehydrogenase-like beta-hydroxyacid dehydrogenase